MATIYEIDEAIMSLYTAIEEAGGEITPEQEELLAIKEEELNDKAEKYFKIIRQNEADAKSYKEEADFFARKAKTAQNAAKFFKARLQDAMEILGRDKLQTGLFKASICKAGTPSIEVENVSLLPDSYLRHIVEPDKDAIKEALKAGEEIEGCTMTYGRYLRIS